MGKNADESACGTTNSIDPLPNILRSDKINENFFFIDSNIAWVKS